MSDDFKMLLSALRRLGDVEEEIPLTKNGKNSRFLGSVSSKIGGEEVTLGLLHYPWKRSLGVDKINQAFHHTNRTNLDGALMVATKFSKSAIEMASRINQTSDKRIVLLETEEFQAMGI